MFLCLILVKADRFAIISESGTSYNQFPGSTPFEIACGGYGQELKYMTIQAYRIYANRTVEKKNFKSDFGRIRFIEIPGNEFLH